MKHEHAIAIVLVGAIVFVAVYVFSTTAGSGLSFSRITQAFGAFPGAGPGVPVDAAKG